MFDLEFSSCNWVTHWTFHSVLCSSTVGLCHASSFSGEWRHCFCCLKFLESYIITCRWYWVWKLVYPKMVTATDTQVSNTMLNLRKKRGPPTFSLGWEKSYSVFGGRVTHLSLYSCFKIPGWIYNRVGRALEPAQNPHQIPIWVSKLITVATKKIKSTLNYQFFAGYFIKPGSSLKLLKNPLLVVLWI